MAPRNTKSLASFMLFAYTCLGFGAENLYYSTYGKDTITFKDKSLHFSAWTMLIFIGLTTSHIAAIACCCISLVSDITNYASILLHKFPSSRRVSDEYYHVTPELLWLSTLVVILGLLHSHFHDQVQQQKYQ